VSEGGSASIPALRARAYWVLRVLESATLLTILIGIALFAYSLVDIVRIETKPGATNVASEVRELPPTAYPGLALFLGGMVVLQGVRVVLHRYRRADGSARGDARDTAVATTARSDASSAYSDDGPALESADDIGET
jgi:hypothetical protein